MADLLQIGSPAPDFELEGYSPEGSGTVRFRDFRGLKHLVLVFYPEDDTPG
jgi:peroxiredoxin